MRAPLPGVEIRLLPSSHPVQRADRTSVARGVFATRAFPATEGGIWVGDYVGHVREEHTLDGIVSRYVMEIPAGPGEARKENGRVAAIDARDVGNETRFINAYVNVAAEPNVVFRTELRRFTRSPDGAGEFVMVR